MSRALLPFSIQDTWFLLETRHIVEVLGRVEWLPIPRNRAQVPGVIVWRGRAMPLLDLAGALPELSPLAPGENRERTLIAEALGSTLAIPVDAASEIVECEDAELRSAEPGHHAALPRELDAGDRVMSEVDLEALLEGLG